MGVEAQVPMLVGRGEELRRLESFLDAVERGPAALVLDGEAGIGKTTLWRAGVDAARSRGYAVLSAMPTAPETSFSFAALGDLLEPVLDEALPVLPEPQRSALEVALLRAEAKELPLDSRGVAAGVLSVLRRLAARAPVVVAIDDVQWLDDPSSAALSFAIRRLRQDSVRLLLTRRVTTDDLPLPLGLERWEGSLERLVVGPLSLGAVHRLLHDRLGVVLGRPMLRRVHETAGGNPFFALELGRALGRRGAGLVPGGAVPVPRSLEALVADRLADLPSRTGEALLCAALAWEPTVHLVGDVLAGDPRQRLRPAVEAEVIEIEAERLRFTHPLLAAAVQASADLTSRHEMHARLAAAVSDPEEQARHMAHAVEPPDETVAAALDDAALRAFERGAIESAAALSASAVRFSAPGDGESLQRRRLEAAGYLARAGAKSEARKLMATARADAEPGPQRARIAIRLAWLGLADLTTCAEALREAIEDARAERALLAEVHAVLGNHLCPVDPVAAGRHASLAVELAEEVGEPALLALALTFATRIDFYTGRGLDRQRLERAIALEGAARQPYGEVAVAPMLLSIALAATGELDAARRSFAEIAAEQRRRGDAGLGRTIEMLAQLVEIPAGRWQRAHELLDEALEIAREAEDVAQEATSLCGLALLAGLRGDSEAARALAAEGLHHAERWPGTRADIHAALGLLELSLGKAEAARGHLETAVEFATASQLDEPGLRPFHGDWIETLVAAGELERAEREALGLEELGRRLGRGLALAHAARGRGLVAAARGDLAEAIEWLSEARSRAEPLGQPFELARTFLALGLVERRAKRRAAARASLEAALMMFAELGAHIWEARARAELARVGGRTRTPEGELTPTERRVAELAAEGRSNKEVASVLFVTVKTVERNLTQVYEKLGVRSRSQLATRLAATRE